MTHYDHATAMAFELDRWSKGRIPRNFEREAIIRAQSRSSRFELEAIAFEQRQSARRVNIKSVFRRCMAAIQAFKSTDALDIP